MAMAYHILVSVGLLLLSAGRVTYSASDLSGELSSLRRKISDGVLRFDDALFDKFGSTPTRDYGLVIFFDAARYHDNSELRLPEMRRQFGIVSQFFLKSHSGENASKLFFCDVDVDSAFQVFDKFGVRSVPHIVYIHPGKGEKVDEYNFEANERSAHGFAAFIKSIANIDVGPIPKPPPFSTVQIITIITSAIIGVPAIPWLLISRRSPVYSPWSWCLLGLAVYLFSVSGGMFNIIRGMPMYVRDSTVPGKYMFFLPQSGAQFGVEGFMLGSLYTVVGLILAFVTYVLPSVKNAWVQRVMMIVSCVASCAAMLQVVRFESMKEGGGDD